MQKDGHLHLRLHAKRQNISRVPNSRSLKLSIGRKAGAFNISIWTRSDEIKVEMCGNTKILCISSLEIFGFFRDEPMAGSHKKSAHVSNCYRDCLS
jgi:hypothetical protein